MITWTKILSKFIFFYTFILLYLVFGPNLIDRANFNSQFGNLCIFERKRGNFLQQVVVQGPGDKSKGILRP